MFAEGKLNSLVTLARSYYDKRFIWLCFHLGGNEAETVSNKLVNLKSSNLEKIKHIITQNLIWNGETQDPLNILPLYQNTVKDILDTFIRDFCSKIVIIKKEINYENLLLVMPCPRYKKGRPNDIYFNLAAYYFSNTIKKNVKLYFPDETIKLLDPFSREWGEGLSNERLKFTIHNKKEVEDFYNGTSINGLIHYSTFKYRQILMSINKLTGMKQTEIIKHVEPSTGSLVFFNSQHASYATALICENSLVQKEATMDSTINPTTFNLQLDDTDLFPPLRIPLHSTTIIPSDKIVNLINVTF